MGLIQSLLLPFPSARLNDQLPDAPYSAFTNTGKVARLYPQYLQIVANTDQGINSIPDVKGKSIAVSMLKDNNAQPFTLGTTVPASSVPEDIGVPMHEDAVKLGLTGYVILFMFVYEPALMLLDNPGTIALAIPASIVGVICLAASLHAFFFFGRLLAYERVLLFIAALSLIKSGWMTDLIGLTCIVIVTTGQLLRRRKTALSRG